MTGRAFADTNVLIYAALLDDPDKAAQAKSTLLVTHVLSVQVLNEFVSASIGKFGRTWPEVEADLALIDQAGFEIQPVTREVHDAAVELARRHHLHIYDACIVAAALEAGCDTLWSEDLQAGRQFDSLTVKNPFEVE